MKKYQINFIYTFEKRDQMVQRFYHPIPKQFLTSMNMLINFAIMSLNKTEQGELVKISCCIVTKGKLPEWYNQCNGKIWLDDLDKYRKDVRIRNRVSTEFREWWHNQNK